MNKYENSFNEYDDYAGYKNYYENFIKPRNSPDTYVAIRDEVLRKDSILQRNELLRKEYISQCESLKSEADFLRSEITRINTLATEEKQKNEKLNELLMLALYIAAECSEEGRNKLIAKAKISIETLTKLEQ